MPTPVQTQEPIRRIDWLGVAPWLLLLRVPEAVLGYPLLIGALGTVLLGGVSGQLCPLLACPLVCSRAGCTLCPTQFFGSLAPENGGEILGLVFWAIAWLVLGLLLTHHAARTLTGLTPPENNLSAGRVVKKFGSLLGVLGIILIAALPLALGLALFGFLSQVEWLAYPLSFAWPIALLLAGFPLLLLLGGLLVGWPFLLPATVIDEADSFDATSRMFAYTYQRILRLVFYTVVAMVVGIASGVLLEALLHGLLMLTRYCTGVPEGVYPEGTEVLVRALRGYYPAYFFTAVTAIYLLLRQDIDSKPMDELA